MKIYKENHMRLTDQQLTDIETWSANNQSTRAAREIAALTAEVRAARAIAHPIAAWTEEDGPVLWWRFPIEEPPYVGTPLDDDFPEDYHTHWTALVLPTDPHGSASASAGRRMSGCRANVGR